MNAADLNGMRGAPDQHSNVGKHAVAIMAAGSEPDGEKWLVGALIHPRTRRTIDPWHTPLDAKTAAYLIHRSRWFVEGIKVAKHSPFSGRYTTYHLITKWIMEHPEFRASHQIEQRARELADAREFDKRCAEIVAKAKGRREHDEPGRAA